MIASNSENADELRRTLSNFFLTTAIENPEFPSDIGSLYWALSLRADAVVTPRCLNIANVLAREDTQILGHLELVPRESI